jgi:uncharacterized protein
MKQTIFAVLALAFSIVTYAQADNRITIGTIDTIQSTILNEKRKILVYVPKSSSNAVFTQQTFPVVYLLDGDAHFNLFVSMIQHLSQVNGNTLCPEMIVVGIANTARTRDLTPTKSGDDPFLKHISTIAVQTSGRGEAFISFIEKELMPYINSKYPTQPYKILVGHSFGGLTVMNAVINHTRLFNTYIAIDPSMWWDNLNFLKATKKGLAEKGFHGTTLYVGIANTVDQEVDFKKVVKDTTIEMRGIRSILEMDNFIKTRKPEGLKYASRYYADDTHNSVPLIATYDALRFIFADYQLKLQNKDVLDSTAAFAEKYRLRYQKISNIFGYEVKPPESETNVWAYRFLQRKHFRKAESFFRMNVQNYPESSNAYDSYGDFFVAIGDKIKAIEFFQKALSLKENAATRSKLNKLLE